jgi:2-methylcitrate dehydratase PrpD
VRLNFLSLVDWGAAPEETWGRAIKFPILHNASVFHPATVVFPPVLAVAQRPGISGRDLLTAAVVGYEVGIRVGEFLGRSHYKVFHTTGTAGTIAAAAAAGGTRPRYPAV